MHCDGVHGRRRLATDDSEKSLLSGADQSGTQDYKVGLSGSFVPSLAVDHTSGHQIRKCDAILKKFAPMLGQVGRLWHGPKIETNGPGSTTGND